MKINYPDSLTIQQYLEGKLDPAKAHELEKQALDDPFLWDALEGYSVYRDPAADLSILQRQLHERIVHLQENKKVFDLSWQRLSVAAAAAVMFVSAGILFWMISHRGTEQLASQSHKPVEVNVIDRDSVESVIRAKDEPVIASLKKPDTESNPATISKSRSENPIEKKALISPEVQSNISSGSQAPSISRIDEQAMAATKARQAKVARAEDSNPALNETVVKGYTRGPKSGWLSYREYLEKNTIKFSADPIRKGTVILSFMVGPDGKLTDIKVLKGLDDAYNQEAIRIVKSGSEWTPASDGKTYQSRIEVNFPR